MRIDENQLYTSGGWLNVPYLAGLNAWCIAVIGPRQVGKTYGVIKYLLDNDIYHMYMRRTIDEMELISQDPDYNPYLPLEGEGYHTDIVKMGKGWVVGDYDPEDEEHKVIKRRGTGLPLSRIAKIRGFGGSKYKAIVLDEFIPEGIVVVRKSEGDAFRNALITIEGNRFLEGKQPVKVFLLANANDMFSPIMVSMNLVNTVEGMIRRGEKAVLTKTGVAVVLPDSREVISRRLKDPMMRHLNDGSAFGKMAFENQFAYNKTRFVRPESLKGYTPVVKAGRVYIWGKGDRYYVTMRSSHNGPSYADDTDGKVLFALEYPFMVLAYQYELIGFADALSLYFFKDFCGIKD